MSDDAPDPVELQQALQKAERPGFGVRNWADVHNLTFVAIMLLGCIGWGLKLEWRIDSHQAQFQALRDNVAELNIKIDKGILPITVVELASIKEKLVAMHEELRSLQLAINILQSNQIVYRQNEELKRK